MEHYWIAKEDNASTTSKLHSHHHHHSNFDEHRMTLITSEGKDGWRAELRQYLKNHPKDVGKDTDVVKWWQVGSYQFISHSIHLLSPWIMSIGSHPQIPHPRKNCPQHPRCPSLIHPLWMTFLCCKTCRNRPLFMPQLWALWTASNHEVCVEGECSRSNGMEFWWDWNSGFEGVWGPSCSGQQNSGLG